ncbi:MAG: NADH-quinone oxidoreductase subunit N [Chloroflexi bacterium]|nr:NADH-quinone oxidoreductase subunit N [Chloroflexota bacterium]
MNAISVTSLGSLMPEIILLIGGLLILILDTAMSEENDSGRGYMAIAVVFLLAAIVPVYLLLNTKPHTALMVVDVDPFAVFMKFTIYIGMALVAITGGSFMNQHVKGRGEFWTLFMFVTIAMSLAVSANNLILLFLSIEFLSITSYLLVGFIREDQRSSEAGVKYFLYGSVASSIMLYGMSMLYGATGSLMLVDIGKGFAANKDLGTLVLPAVLLVLVGLGFKTSLAPFHQWAPDTYEGAPTPVTAYLSTASKTVGFAVIVRVLLIGLGSFSHEWVPILAGLSIFTMTVGNLVALRQTSVKRTLAYSSVAQAGYILMGLVAVVSSTQGDLKTLAMNGLNGLMIYLFAYLFTNVGAFMVVMAVEAFTGGSDISAFENLSRRSPALAWSMFIFLLSLTGIPLTGGFMGKFFVFGAAVQHQYYWLTAIALINTGIAGFYYLNIIRAMFFGTSGIGTYAGEVAASGEGTVATSAMSISIPIQIGLVICVIATVWIGLYPPSVIEWANNASRTLLGLGS